MAASTRLVVLLVLGMVGSGWAAGGDVDPTFGVGGFVEHPVPARFASRFAVDASGRIVMGDGVGSFTLWMRRFLPDGSVDAAFGVGGAITTEIPPLTADSNPDVVLIDDAAGIVARTSRWLIRFDASGTLVPGFGSGGIQAGAWMDVSDGTLAPGGGILIAGQQCPLSGCSTTIERRHWTDGSLDAGFGTAGAVTHAHVSVFKQPPQIGLQSDGSLVVSSDGQLIRYLADGTRDLAFGPSGGAAALPLEGACDLAVLGDDRIVVALDHHAVARFTADGMPDVTFGSGGVSRIASVLFPGGTDSSKCRLLVDADGTATVLHSVYLYDASGGYSRLVRFTPAGEIDAGFAPCGFAAPAGIAAWEAAPLPDGQMLLMGYFNRADDYMGEGTRLRFARLGTPPASSCLPAVPGTARDRRRGKLSARWKVAGDVPLSAFGDPRGASGYVLCVLPDTGGLGDVNGIIPLAGGTSCRGKPCWKGSATGYRHRGYKVRLTAGTAGRARVAVYAGVSGLSGGQYGRWLSTLPVTLRLDRIDGPECWEASFPSIE